MHILKKKTVYDFCKKHRNADSVITLYNELSKHSYASSKEIIDHYSRSSLLAGNRIVFRLGGNKYRAIIKFDFKRQVGFIEFVGTHAEYDKLKNN